MYISKLEAFLVSDKKISLWKTPVPFDEWMNVEKIGRYLTFWMNDILITQIACHVIDLI